MIMRTLSKIIAGLSAYAVIATCLFGIVMVALYVINPSAFESIKEFLQLTI